MSSACAVDLIKHRQLQIAHFGLTPFENQMYWSAQTHCFLLILKLIQRCRMKIQDRFIPHPRLYLGKHISVQHLTPCNKLNKCQLTLLTFQGWWVLGMDPSALVLRGEGNSPVLEQSLSSALPSHWGTGWWGRTAIPGSHSAGRFSSGWG